MPSHSAGESDLDRVNSKKRTRPDDDVASLAELAVAPKLAGKAQEQSQRKKKKVKGSSGQVGS